MDTSDNTPEEKNRERQRRYREKNREAINERRRRRRLEKPDEDRNYYIAHSEKIKARSSKYQREHPERRRVIQQTYRDRHREKTRQYWRTRHARKKHIESTLTAKQVQELYARQRGKCYYCGKKVGKKYHVDHVVPLSRGGADTMDNAAIACPHCNVVKSDKLPHEWPEGGRLC